MSSNSNLGLARRAHFLGPKLRSLRKRNGLTLDDLSARCLQLDPANGPSVSYLSMIETGKRVPSEKLLEILGDVFQKDVAWFLDDTPADDVAVSSAEHGKADEVPLEPKVLFSQELLQTAIPDLLAQTGTTARQFSRILIRSYQEKVKNQFPDLERAAEEVGKKQFPLSVDDLLGLCKRHGLEIKWFKQNPFVVQDDAERDIRTLVRSYFDSPGVVHINQGLKKEPERLKYDLACNLAHKVLHDGDGLKSGHATGGAVGGSPKSSKQRAYRVDPQEILFAWRDFECSFFAGALLCPRLPFRRFVIREAYDPFAASKVELTPAVVMRRITAVSPYKHWHYLDAYPPGYLRAVYRANRVPMPLGLMGNPPVCPQWSTARTLGRPRKKPLVQISVPATEGGKSIFVCNSVYSQDAAKNRHVVTLGVDLGPVLESQGLDAEGLVERTLSRCQNDGGQAELLAKDQVEIQRVGRILNIGWLETGLQKPVRVICPGAGMCSRKPSCFK
ncbi:MAG: helix-turn-helix transcriptional regulator [Pseudomonadota bacterium]